MRIERLRVDGLRCLDVVDVRPGPGLNLLLGPNGAGKTSFLEAAYLLSYGRSFRSGSNDTLLHRGTRKMHVYGEIADRAGRVHRLGLGREPGRWEIRIDGADASRLSELIRHCAVVCFEPGSHALIAGPAEERRRFLDWGVFHVEQGFLATWQRYRRALKQRNVLLRASEYPASSLLEPWEKEMDQAATGIDACRQRYLKAFEPELRDICGIWLSDLGKLQLQYRRGWDPQRPLLEVLQANRERDRQRGHTTQGVHRADWQPGFEGAPRREHFSRGQEKLCALACVMAQARVHAACHQEWPVVCLDDLASELDATRQQAVLDLVLDGEAQIFVTGTTPGALSPRHDAMVFHVEQGRIAPVTRPG